MPSVGPTEVLLLLVIALLVLGPTKLPELGRQLGRGIRQFREAARNVTREMGAEDLVEDLKGLNEARGTFGQTVRKELGLDELGAFPDLDEVGKDKPAPAESPAVPVAAVTTAVAAEVPVAATPVVPAAAEAAADVPVAAAAVEVSPGPTEPPADPPTPRKRTRKPAAEKATAEEATAAPAPRKRAPKAAAAAAPADESAAPAAPRPVRKRAPRVKPSEPA
jgi:TatA/E family protein of Tat protein translocase